jgi:hypothetical protein
VDAVRCAVEVQRGMAERNADVPEEKKIEFRIGINVGDVIIDVGDIFGDGVNVASRLEGIAEPGGKLDIVFEDLGELELKNIARSVRAYRVRLEGGRSKSPCPKYPTCLLLLCCPSGTSAVIPSRNTSPMGLWKTSPWPCHAFVGCL